MPSFSTLEGINHKRYRLCMANTPEVIEIEEYTKRGQKIPPGTTDFTIRVDKDKIIVHVDRLTGTEILDLVHKKPEKYKLYEHVKGQQPKEVLPDEVEIFSKHMLERFSTFAKDT